jgi:ribose transport system ATP-binding protein
MLLALEGIQKRYGGVAALKNGRLRVDRGEVHLLLGENGAGKSTLMKIVAGMTAPDAGEFLWQGSAVRFRRPADAASVGIAMVHQESLLAPHLSVAENIFLGREERLPFGWVRTKRMREQTARLIAEHGFPLQPEWRVEKLSPAGKQLVEICRALAHGSSLIIFDEPTSSLSEAEAREVFRIVRGLRGRNLGVIYITHRLEELREVGDRVTILRDGETVHESELQAVDTAAIIRHMVGREVTTLYKRQPQEPGEELLRTEKLSRPPLLSEINLSLRAGEIVGVAGLIGAGRTELCRALFGIEPPTSGCIYLQGRPVTIDGPRAAVRAGLALIPEDRQRHGLAPVLPLAYNITAAHLHAVSRAGGMLDRKREREVSAQFLQRLRIRAESPRQLAGKLSGGNQQKVVIAKWLLRQARVFLFDEPTRGIDVGAKAEVFSLMDELARQGAALLMVSSELPELLQMADRIVVMRAGRIRGELPRGAAAEEVMRLAAFESDPGLMDPAQEQGS